jgi:aminoglycoside phosphotransferase (APT) family kinase protein
VAVVDFSERDGAASSALGTVPEIGIATARVADWLARTTPQLRPPLTFERVAGGRSNLTFLVVDADGRRIVLRRPPLGPLAESAHDVGREHRILQALSPTAVPVPRPLGACADPGVLAAPFYVMDFVDGVVLRDEADAAAFPVPSRAQVGPAMVDVLAELHAVDPAAVGLERLGRGADYVDRQLRRWQRQWDATSRPAVPAVAAAHALLVRDRPAQQRTTLVHGDFRIDNVVLHPSGSVAAVLDWELCTLGDPLADLGMLSLTWIAPGEPRDALMIGTPTAAGGFSPRAQLVDRYARRTGADVGALAYYVALAYWKLAVITQGMHDRYASGAMGGSDAEYAGTLAHKVGLLAEEAIASLDGG